MMRPAEYADTQMYKKTMQFAHTFHHRYGPIRGSANIGGLLQNQC